MTKRILLTLMLLLPAFAFGQVARTGFCSSTSTSCTLSGTATNDLKIVWAYRTNSATPPSLAGGWTNISSGVAIGGTSYRVACIKSTGAADTSTGTWTSASGVVSASYSGTAVGTSANCNTTGLGATSAISAAANTTISFPALTLSKTDGTSWVGGFEGTFDNNNNCTPAGFTKYTSFTKAAGFDTAGGVSSWSAHTCTITSGTWAAIDFEILQGAGNPPAAVPTFSPIPPVNTGTAVTISTTTAGCGPYIKYTTDGSTPSVGNGTVGTSVTINGPVTVNAKVIGCPSYTDSAQGSATYNFAATPTISPAAGLYFVQQSITLACSTGSPSIYYTTDGSTPTTGSTLYSGAFNSASSGSQTIKALCTATGYGNSTAASSTYSINPTPTELATDDFSTYFHPEFQYQQGTAGNGSNGETQYPLDSYWTGGKWIAVGVISGATTNAAPAYNFIAPVGPENCIGTTGVCVAGGGGQYIMAASTAVSYSADQYSKTYIKSNTSVSEAGVCVRCSTAATTSTGYVLTVSPGSGTGSAHVGKIISGTPTWFCSLATGLTIANGSTVELRIAGSVLYPLVNGASIPGCSATYTDSAITQGNPGLATAGGGVNNAGAYAYNWSGGNVGGAVANSTPATNWSYGTYSDAFTATASAYPWMKFMTNRGYYPTVLTLNGTTGYGPTGDAGPGKGTVIQQYQAPFGPTGQYQKWTVAVDTFQESLNNWFMPLQTERWTPGYVGASGVPLGSDSGCHIAGTDAVCDDEVAYYPGVQPHNSLIKRTSVDTHCTGTVGKIEFTCSPAMHITKVTPAASPANQVVTVASSNITPLKGDQWYDEYTGGHLRVACKGVGFNTQRQSNHAYALNDLILDSNGNLQRVIVAGTSAGTAPATWGNTWGVPVGQNYILKGATTPDGGVTWEYYLQPCPTSSTWSWVIDAADSDLQGRLGFPGLWMGGDSPDGTAITASPFIKNWEAGTATVNTACSLLSLCTSGEATTWTMW